MNSGFTTGLANFNTAPGNMCLKIKTYIGVGPVVQSGTYSSISIAFKLLLKPLAAYFYAWKSKDVFLQIQITYLIKRVI